MSKPLCPNCRERMSPVEAGLCGVWSCVYCEGVWLPAEEVDALASKAAMDRQAIQWPHHAEPNNENFQCPVCRAAWFARRGVKDHPVCLCTKCRGMFISKQSVLALSAHLHTEPWFSKSDVTTTVAIEVAGNLILLALAALAS